MKWVADENIDRQVVAALRALGHEVAYIAEIDPAAGDPDILRLAKTMSALLLTADKDFGDIVYRLKHATDGVVLLRLHGMDPDHKAELLSAVVEEHGDELLGAFTVVTEDKVRIRK